MDCCRHPAISAALGSTFLQVLGRYQDRLEVAGGHLLHGGVEGRAMTQLSDTGMLQRLGPDNVFPVTPTLGEPVRRATERAERLRGETA